MTKRNDPDGRPSSPEGNLSDPGGNIDEILDALADQPRELKPKWTPKSEGRDRAAFEANAPVPAGHPTAPPQPAVLVRPSVVSPSPPRAAAKTVLTGRAARRQLGVAVGVGVGLVAVIVIVLAVIRSQREAGASATTAATDATRTSTPSAATATPTPPPETTPMPATPRPAAMLGTPTEVAASGSPPPVAPLMSSRPEISAKVQASPGKGIASSAPAVQQAPRPASSLPNAHLYDPERK